MKGALSSFTGLALALAAAASSQGCMLFGGLHVDTVATSAQKPANVAMFIAVQRGDEPTTGLTEKSFQISEDGQELSAEQTQQRLLPNDVAAVHRALLLVDMSGPVTEGDTRHQISLAAARFVARAHTAEPVTVYAFDGGPSIRFIADFPQGPDDIPELQELTNYTPSDASSNLNGAIVEAAAQLDARLMSVQRPIRIGSLVVFARGPDLAGRVPDDKVRDALDDSKHLVFAITIKDTPGLRPQKIGRTGVFEAESKESILHTFDEAGERIASNVGRYYLLSYCSPARAGTRRVRVKVVTADEDGKEVSGTASTEFDSNGFGSGCNPEQTPRFVAAVKSAPAEHDHEEKIDTEKADKSDKAEGSSRPSSRPRSSEPPKAAPAEPTDDDTVVPPPSKPGYAP